jgi:hypothetical protein
MYKLQLQMDSEQRLKISQLQQSAAYDFKYFVRNLDKSVKEKKKTPEKFSTEILRLYRAAPPPVHMHQTDNL